MFHDGSVTTRPTDISIDEYLRERLMPVEGSIPHISGIEMYGNSVPVESVGGDLFEYINFQQRYDIEVKDASARARHDGIPAFQPTFQPTSERSHVCDSLPF